MGGEGNLAPNHPSSSCRDAKKFFTKLAREDRVMMTELRRSQCNFSTSVQGGDILSVSAQSESKECISAGIVLAESSSDHKLRRLITEIVGTDLRREALQARMYPQLESISAEGVKANRRQSPRFQARFV